MARYKATLTLIPTSVPRRTQKFPGNFPNTEVELLDELEEIERVKQIQTDTRELVFTPTRTTIQIGRASSNLSKSLTSAPDNGYFLSPVMSRYHAQIHMIEEKKVIRIRDTNSMHGTYVNGTPIWDRQWKCLRSGDGITFGTQVVRDGEIFTPKDFKCDVRWEKIDPEDENASDAKQEAASTRRPSGYGVTGDDLVVSDEDSLCPLYSEGEYSDYMREDETDEDDMDRDSEMSSPQPEDGPAEADNLHKDQDMDMHPPASPQRQAEIGSSDVRPVVYPTIESSRSKFSIGSLMNDTKESAIGTNQLCDSMDVTTCDEEVDAPTTDKGKEPAASESRPKLVYFPLTVAECDSDVSSDSDEAPEELDSKGLTIGDDPRPAEPEQSSAPAEFAMNYVVSPPTLAATAQLPERGSNVVKVASVVKPAEAEANQYSESLNTTPSTTNTNNTTAASNTMDVSRNHMAAASNTMTATNDDKQPTPRPTMLDESWQRAGRSMFGPPFMPMHDLNSWRMPVNNTPMPPPLPWIKDQFAANATGIESASSNRAYPVTQATTRSESSNLNKSCSEIPRKPHLFEQILSSDEAKARVAKLETLKAAVNHAMRYSTWDESDYDEDEDEQMNEKENVASVPVVTMESNPASLFTQELKKSFSIRNLVNEQPKALETALRRTWLAQKVSKDTKEPECAKPKPEVLEPGYANSKPEVLEPVVESFRGTKRGHDDISEDDARDDKVGPSEAPSEGRPTADETNVISKVNDTHEETSLAPTIEEALSQMTEKMEIEPVDAIKEEVKVNSEEPTPKRVRLWPSVTAGFAAGAIAGAAGMFAALLSTAPSAAP